MNNGLVLIRERIDRFEQRRIFLSVKAGQRGWEKSSFS